MYQASITATWVHNLYFLSPENKFFSYFMLPFPFPSYPSPSFQDYSALTVSDSQELHLRTLSGFILFYVVYSFFLSFLKFPKIMNFYLYRKHFLTTQFLWELLIFNRSLIFLSTLFLIKKLGNFLPMQLLGSVLCMITLACMIQCMGKWRISSWVCHLVGIVGFSYWLFVGPYSYLISWYLLLLLFNFFFFV